MSLKTIIHMIELMSKDSLCIQQKDCAGCPKATEGILIHRHMLRGQHIPKDKCTQNCMLFIIKGELLVNSDEYPELPCTTSNSSCKPSARSTKHWHLQIPNTLSSGSTNCRCFAKTATAKSSTRRSSASLYPSGDGPPTAQPRHRYGGLS